MNGDTYKMTRTILQHSREISGGESGITVRTGDSPAIDAFARLRVSNPAGLFDSQMQYDTSNLLWETSPATGTFATHLPNESSVRLRVTGGQTVIRQTRQYHRYQPGKSQLILMTFVCSQPAVSVYQRIGYFDSANGIFFQVNDNDAGLDFVLRSSASGSPDDTTIDQADWNLDTLDGSGDAGNPSGIRLDITQSQILLIDLEWLGVGRVRVGFVIDGIPVYCHQFLNANVNNTVYMTTANLPLRYEISAGAGLPNNYDLKQICSQVSSEGGFENERGFPFDADTSPTGTVAVTTRKAVLSIRPKATFNGLVNRAQIVPESYNIGVTTNSALVEVVYNGTLPTGTAWVSAKANSVTEYAINAGAVTGGIKIFSEFIPAAGTNANNRIGEGGDALLSRLPVVLDMAGANPINVSLVVTAMTGTSNIDAAMRWREVR